MDEEPVIKEEPYSDGELDPLQTNNEAAAESEVSCRAFVHSEHGDDMCRE
jgi:hypothetical protein